MKIEELARKEILKFAGKTAIWLKKHVGILDWELLSYSLSFMGGVKIAIMGSAFGMLYTMFSNYSQNYLSIWGGDFESQTKFTYLFYYMGLTFVGAWIDQINLKF